MEPFTMRAFPPFRKHGAIAAGLTKRDSEQQEVNGGVKKKGRKEERESFVVKDIYCASGLCSTYASSHLELHRRASSPKCGPLVGYAPLVPQCEVNVRSQPATIHQLVALAAEDSLCGPVKLE